MKLSLRRIFIFGFIATFIMAPMSASAVFESGSGDAAAVPTSSTSPANKAKAEQALRQQLAELKQERSAAITTAKTDLNQKLDDAKRKICENHQTQINSIITTMDTRRQTAYDKITAIATAIQNFYATKNLTASNYDSLVAAVNAAKSAAITAMQTQQSAAKLDCSSSKSRADVSDFKSKRSDSIDAMGAYRDAVKDLAKAVRAVAPAPSPSPKEIN